MKGFSWKLSSKKIWSFTLTKIDLSGDTKQKPSCLLDLEFAVKYEIKLLKSKKKVTNNWLVRFKKEAVEVKMCTQLIGKTYFHLVLSDVPDAYHQYLLQSVQILLKLLLKNSFPNLSIAPTVADKAKSEYHKFVTMTVKEKKSEFLNFDKKVQ